MTKDELLLKIDQRVDSLFSTPEFYDNTRIKGAEAYEKYIAEKGKEDSFILLCDFINEAVMKKAITTAMHETINLLVEEGVISEK